jgi:hypothetical protein
MKRKRFTGEQITFALRQAESGVPLGAVVTAGQAHGSKTLETLMNTVRIGRRRRPRAIGATATEVFVRGWRSAESRR